MLAASNLFVKSVNLFKDDTRLFLVLSDSSDPMDGMCTFF